jgi:hypothetical protein
VSRLSLLSYWTAFPDRKLKKKPPEKEVWFSRNVTLRTEKIQGENRNNKGNDDKGYMTEINDQRKEVKESNNQDALKKSFHEREAEGKEETRNSRKQKNDDKDDKRKETRRKHEQE